MNDSRKHVHAFIYKTFKRNNCNTKWNKFNLKQWNLDMNQVCVTYTITIIHNSIRYHPICIYDVNINKSVLASISTSSYFVITCSQYIFLCPCTMGFKCLNLRTGAWLDNNLLFRVSINSYIFKTSKTNDTDKNIKRVATQCT